MTKHIFKGPCPCGDFEFKLDYSSATEMPQELLYCVFCGAEIDEEIEELDDFDDDE